MRYFVHKQINVAGLGTITKGREVELPDSVAGLYAGTGAIEAVAAREIRENPVQPVGEVPSASQAGQASQSQTLPQSSDGARRRGRPRKTDAR